MTKPVATALLSRRLPSSKWTTIIVVMVVAMVATIGPRPCLSTSVLVPILECSHNYGNGTCETFYGYSNSDGSGSGVAIERPVSAVANASANYFFPAPYNRGQPTVFANGDQRDVFSVVWPCTTLSDSLMWTLDQAVAITAQVVSCPLGCDHLPYSYATFDACGVCGGDSSECNGIAQSSSIQSNGYCKRGNDDDDDDDDDDGPNNCGQDTNDQNWGSDSEDDDSFKGGGGGIKRNCTKTMSASKTPTQTPSKSQSSTKSASASTTASATPSSTRTLSATVTGTGTASVLPSNTASATSAPSASSTASTSLSTTASATAPPSASSTVSTSLSGSTSSTYSPSGTPSTSLSSTASASVPPSCSHGASITGTASSSGTSSQTPSPSASTTSTTSQSATPSTTSSASQSTTSTATQSASNSGTLPPTCSHTPSLSPSLSPSASSTSQPTCSHTPSETASQTASQTPSVSHSATPVPTPIPSGSCPPLHVNISLDIVDNVTVRMLPCEHQEVKRRRSVDCAPPHQDEPECCMPVIEFCYVATTEVEWSSLIVDFAPVADDPTSCLVNEPQSRCRIRLPPQQICGAQAICITLTLEELLLNCTLDNDEHTPVLEITEGDEPGQTFYNGVFYVGVAINWEQIVDPEIFDDFPTCNATGVLLRHSAHPFNVTVNAHGTEVACYQIASPSLDAYVAGVWWLPDGEVHIKLVTRLEMSEAGPTWLQDASVYLPKLEGVEFQFVDDFVPCDPNAPDADTVCTQHWLLESVGGFDEQDFSGLKPLRFDVFVQGYGVIRTAHIDLHLSLHRFWHVEQMTQDLSATLVLARDREFEQVYVQPPDDVASWPFFHDCDLICAKIGLCISDDWAQYFDMVVDRVQLCTCPDAMLVLPFDPEDPDHTGCNTPNMPGLVNVVIYDRESNVSNGDFNFSFVSDPPELHSGEEAFCWLSKNIGSMRYLLQVRWFADGHPAPNQQQQQRKRGLMYDSSSTTNPLTQAHGAASNVFTVGCDERLHIFVPGHGCRPKDCCDNNNNNSDDFWHTWFIVLCALGLCLLLGVLAVGVCRGCAHDHHEYPLLVDEVQRPAHHHHHHHHDTSVPPPSVSVVQQWGISGPTAGTSMRSEDKQSLLPARDRAPRRHHKRTHTAIIGDADL